MARSIQKFEQGPQDYLVLAADTDKELASMREHAITVKGWQLYLEGTCPKTNWPSCWLIKDNPAMAAPQS